MSTLMSPLALGASTFRNRLWVAPMCQYSAIDGVPQEWHHVHLAQFASGGAGLVIAEATAVSAEGRISPEDVGLWTDEQRDAWRPITAAIRSRGAVPGVQLAHAGRKASTWAPFAAESGTVPTDRGGWQTVAPSAIAFAGYDEPRALSLEDIDRVVADFAAAAVRAIEAGFEVLEVHAAHGYLLHQFLSPLSNQRTDAYGGSAENRRRLLERVVVAVRDAAPGATLFVRFSATDWADGGWDVDDTVAAARILSDLGVHLFDVSSGGLVAHQKITVGPGYQVPLAHAVRAGSGAPVAAVGMIDTPALAEQVLQDGDADAVLSARQWLRDPHFALRAEVELEGRDADTAALWPAQYARARR